MSPRHSRAICLLPPKSTCPSRQKREMLSKRGKSWLGTLALRSGGLFRYRSMRVLLLSTFSFLECFTRNDGLGGFITLSLHEHSWRFVAIRFGNPDLFGIVKSFLPTNWQI